MGTVLLFKSKTWSPFETALRHELVKSSNVKGTGVKDHLVNLVSSNAYPEGFETPYKIHTILAVLFSSELEEFKKAFKGKFSEDDPLSASNTYFLRVMSIICKSYGLDMLEVAKGKK